MENRLISRSVGSFFALIVLIDKVAETEISLFKLFFIWDPVCTVMRDELVHFKELPPNRGRTSKGCVFTVKEVKISKSQ